MADAFDEIMGCIDPAMIVVTVADGDERSGCLVGFHAQSGIDPLRYCVWLSKANRTYSVMQRSDSLAIHFLADTDMDVAELFGGATGDSVDKFTLTPTDTGDDGVPLLRRLPNRIVARKLDVMDDGSDHVCVTTEPTSVSFADDFRPLRLSRAEDISAGHDAGEQTHP